MISRTTQWTASVCIAVSAMTMPAAAAGSLTGVGLLSAVPNATSRTAAISGDGTTVIGYASNNSTGATFRWKDGVSTFTNMPLNPVMLAAISSDGNTIVGLVGTYAYISTPTGSQPLPGVDNRTFSPRGMSGDGKIVVGTTDGFLSKPTHYAARWTQTTGTVLLPQGSDSDYAASVNSDGSTIVGSSGRFACRWTNNGLSSLGTLPDKTSSSFATDTSADGSVIVGSSYSGFDREAFRWTTAGMAGLGDLPGGSFDSQATAVSADGSVAVGYGTSAAGSEAAIFTENRVNRLWDVLVANGIDPAAAGWTRLTSIVDVSADGRTVAGDGLRNGTTEGFVAVIPEPSAGLALAAVAGCLRRVRRI